MKYLVRICALIAFSCLCVAPAQGAIVFSTQSRDFDVARAYTFDIIAAALGEQEIILGFNASLDFSDPALSFESVSYNPAFEQPGPPIAPGASPALLQASDTNFSGVVIGDGESAVVATVTVNGNGPGAAPLAVTVVVDETFGPATDFSVDPQAGALRLVTAIPEPSGFLLCTVIGSAVMLRRRRR